MCTIFYVLSHFMLFCCKISLLCDLRCFVAKSVCRYLRALAWRKIGPKMLSVEKKGQISGMMTAHIGRPHLDPVESKPVKLMTTSLVSSVY